MSSFLDSQNDNTTLGKTFINFLFIEKDYSKAYTLFDESIKSQISETLLEETISQIENQFGKFNSIIEINNEVETYFYYSDFENIKLDIKISFNENSKIIGFFFIPHKEFKKENT